jgi:hypothetical protein
MLIPDPGFFHPGSRIFPSRIKNQKVMYRIPYPETQEFKNSIFNLSNPKNLLRYQALEYMIRDVYSGSYSKDPRFFFLSQIPGQNSTGSRVPDPQHYQKPSMRTVFLNVSELDPLCFCSPGSRSNTSDKENIKLNCFHNFSTDHLSRTRYGVPSWLVVMVPAVRLEHATNS